VNRPIRAILFGLGVIFAVIALLFFTASAVYGQAASAPTASAPVPDCLPKNSVFNGTGTDYGEFETDTVAGRMGWCPEIDNTWGLYVHQWCLKTVCGKAPLTTTAVLLGAIDRIRAATDPIAQIKLEWKTSGIPLATPLEVWQYNDWRYQACQWLTATQPGVTPRPSTMPIAIPKKLPTDIDPLLPPMSYCEPWNPGVKPSPTPPPPIVYVVTGAIGTQRDYYNVVNGIRQTAPVGKVAAGAVCDCASGSGLEIIEFNVIRYCKIPAVQLAVTNCTVKK
jgi:hypothetical protein